MPSAQPLNATPRAPAPQQCPSRPFQAAQLASHPAWQRSGFESLERFIFQFLTGGAGADSGSSNGASEGGRAGVESVRLKLEVCLGCCARSLCLQLWSLSGCGKPVCCIEARRACGSSWRCVLASFTLYQFATCLHVSVAIQQGRAGAESGRLKSWR